MHGKPGYIPGYPFYGIITYIHTQKIISPKFRTNLRIFGKFQKNLGVGTSVLRCGYEVRDERFEVVCESKKSQFRKISNKSENFREVSKKSRCGTSVVSG